MCQANGVHEATPTVLNLFVYRFLLRSWTNAQHRIEEHQPNDRVQNDEECCAPTKTEPHDRQRDPGNAGDRVEEDCDRLKKFRDEPVHTRQHAKQNAQRYANRRREDHPEDAGEDVGRHCA